MFHTPQCQQCRQGAQEYESVANTAKGVVSVGAVDCADHRDLCAAQGVRRHPTIRLYADGQRYAGYLYGAQ